MQKQKQAGEGETSIEADVGMEQAKQEHAKSDSIRDEKSQATRKNLHKRWTKGNKRIEGRASG